jgi:hypothetical protein
MHQPQHQQQQKQQQQQQAKQPVNLMSLMNITPKPSSQNQFNPTNDINHNVNDGGVNYRTSSFNEKRKNMESNSFLKNDKRSRIQKGSNRKDRERDNRQGQSGGGERHDKNGFHKADIKPNSAAATALEIANMSNRNNVQHQQQQYVNTPIAPTSRNTTAPPWQYGAQSVNQSFNQPPTSTFSNPPQQNQQQQQQNVQQNQAHQQQQQQQKQYYDQFYAQYYSQQQKQQPQATPQPVAASAPTAVQPSQPNVVPQNPYGMFHVPGFSYPPYPMAGYPTTPLPSGMSAEAYANYWSQYSQYYQQWQWTSMKQANANTPNPVQIPNASHNPT